MWISFTPPESLPLFLRALHLLLKTPVCKPNVPSCFTSCPRRQSDLSDDIKALDLKESRHRARADFIAEVAALTSPLQDHISTLKTSEWRGNRKIKARAFFLIKWSFGGNVTESRKGRKWRVAEVMWRSCVCVVKKRKKTYSPRWWQDVNLHVSCCGWFVGKEERSTGTHKSLHLQTQGLVSTSTGYLHSLRRKQSRHTSSFRTASSRPDLRRGRLFNFKSIATLPLTDCKRRFISRPAAALQSVIVIQRWRKSCHRVLVIFGGYLPALFFFYQPPKMFFIGSPLGIKAPGSAGQCFPLQEQFM